MLGFLPAAARADETGAAPRESRHRCRDAPPQTVGHHYDSDDSLPTRATPMASYQLSARLDAEAHVITGAGTLTWTNTSRKSQSEIYLHLYLNTFKNNRTLYLRSPFQAGRSGRRASSYGHVDGAELPAARAGRGPVAQGRCSFARGSARRNRHCRPAAGARRPGRHRALRHEVRVEAAGHRRTDGIRRLLPLRGPVVPQDCAPRAGRQSGLTSRFTRKASSTPTTGTTPSP